MRKSCARGGEKMRNRTLAIAKMRRSDREYRDLGRGRMLLNIPELPKM